MRSSKSPDASGEVRCCSSFLIDSLMRSSWSLIEQSYREVEMAKEKSNGKISEIDKTIAGLEEKISVAEVNKNKQEVAALTRLLDYWKSKKKGKP